MRAFSQRFSVSLAVSKKQHAQHYDLRVTRETYNKKSLLHYMQRYEIPLCIIVDGLFVASIYSFVQGSYDKSTVESAKLADSTQTSASKLLAEVLKLRDGSLDLPHGQSSLTRDDLNYIIEFLCIE
jgi:hypothetical protein